MYVFLLSKENIEIAKEEVIVLANKSNFDLFNNLLILDCKDDFFDRLAYTKRIYSFLFKINSKILKNKIKNFNWNSIYKGSFCLRTTSLDKNRMRFSEPELASIVWNNLKKPKVDLKNPKTTIELFFLKDIIICCSLLKEVKQDFKSRKPHLRPGFHPSSLNPRLARAIVNLTGAKNKITDPFCGTGGILIEAGMIGLRTAGYDTDKEMLKKCKLNLDFFKIKNYRLEKTDATSLKDRIDYMVTDLPYGKNTKNIDLEKLYLDFLMVLKRILKKKAVIIFPSFVNYKKLLKKAGINVKKEFHYYIHKNLSKNIVLLVP